MVSGTKELKERLDNSKLFRKNILNLSKKDSAKKMARNHQGYDAEANDFQIRFLRYWHTLEQLPEVQVELDELKTDEEKENKKEELKEKFCENVLGSSMYSAGYDYAENKKDQWKNKIPKKFRK